jgi:hypothetical protein
MKLKLILWLLSLCSPAEKKVVLLKTLDDILESKTTTVDKQLGELVVSKVIKSTGNNITAFIVKD